MTGLPPTPEGNRGEPEGDRSFEFDQIVLGTGKDGFQPLAQSAGVSRAEAEQAVGLFRSISHFPSTYDCSLHCFPNCDGRYCVARASKSSVHADRPGRHFVHALILDEEMWSASNSDAFVLLRQDLFLSSPESGLSTPRVHWESSAEWRAAKLQSLKRFRDSYGATAFLVIVDAAIRALPLTIIHPDPRLDLLEGPLSILPKSLRTTMTFATRTFEAKEAFQFSVVRLAECAPTESDSPSAILDLTKTVSAPPVPSQFARDAARLFDAREFQALLDAVADLDVHSLDPSSASSLFSYHQGLRRLRDGQVAGGRAWAAVIRHAIDARLPIGAVDSCCEEAIRATEEACRAPGFDLLELPRAAMDQGFLDRVVPKLRDMTSRILKRKTWRPLVDLTKWCVRNRYPETHAYVEREVIPGLTRAYSDRVIPPRQTLEALGEIAEELPRDELAYETAGLGLYRAAVCVGEKERGGERDCVVPALERAMAIFQRLVKHDRALPIEAALLELSVGRFGIAERNLRNWRRRERAIDVAARILATKGKLPPRLMGEASYQLGFQALTSDDLEEANRRLAEVICSEVVTTEDRRGMVCEIVEAISEWRVGEQMPAWTIVFRSVCQLPASMAAEVRSLAATIVDEASIDVAILLKSLLKDPDFGINENDFALLAGMLHGALERTSDRSHLVKVVADLVQHIETKSLPPTVEGYKSLAAIARLAQTRSGGWWSFLLGRQDDGRSSAVGPLKGKAAKPKSRKE